MIHVQQDGLFFIFPFLQTVQVPGGRFSVATMTVGVDMTGTCPGTDNRVLKCDLAGEHTHTSFLNG